MTILLPVRRRLALARLWAVLVPAPFTPTEALLRRVEDVLAAGVDIVQIDLDDRSAAEARQLLRRCSPPVGALGRLLVVARDPELAVDLGADALLLGPEQSLPGRLRARLGPGAAVGREVVNAPGMLKAVQDGEPAFLVLTGDRPGRRVAEAYDRGPRAVRDALADPVTAPLPWFLDLGEGWNSPGAVPDRPCRVRFAVRVPASSPADASSPGLRADIRALATRVEQRWASDPVVARHRDAELAAASAASRAFWNDTGRTDTGRTDTSRTGTGESAPGHDDGAAGPQGG